MERLKLTNAQRVVYDNVAQRGYRAGLTSIHFLGQQVLKMVEEVAETAAHFHWAGLSWGRLAEMGRVARINFDRQIPATLAGDLDPAAVEGEMANMQIVLFNMAQAWSEYTGRPFDVVQAAVAKSAADVSRGRRGD